MKQITQISAVTAFFLGSIFVLGHNAEITGNVINSAGSGSSGLAQIIGLLMIIASVGLFIISLENRVEKEKVKPSSESKIYASDQIEPYTPENKPIYENKKE